MLQWRDGALQQSISTLAQGAGQGGLGGVCTCAGVHSQGGEHIWALGAIECEFVRCVICVSAFVDCTLVDKMPLT